MRNTAVTSSDAADKSSSSSTSALCNCRTLTSISNTFAKGKKKRVGKARRYLPQGVGGGRVR
jgi:hypothetical protein